MQALDGMTMSGSNLDTLRKFSGKLSHDFNNLLTPLLAYPALIKMKSNPDEQTAALLDVMERTAADMAHIMRQLTRLSATHAATRPSDYVACFRDALDPLLAELAAEATTRVAVDTDRFLVSAPPEQLDLILTALVRNAIEAGGNVTAPVEVGLSTMHLDAPRACANGTMPEGNYGVLWVIDHGRGLPDDAIPAIFEPFFTTRRAQARRGAGLGLSIVLAALSDCDGYLDFSATSGGGTTVEAFIPLATAAPVSGAQHPSGAAACSRDADLARAYDGRVLVVDDEPMIVESFAMMLTTALPGVEVTVGRDGIEAVALFEEIRPDVIVMDLHMPNMDGFTAFGQIHKRCQALGIEVPSVIFCTGYAPSDAVRGLREHAGDHELIFKPVTGMELIDRVKPHLQVRADA
jgi:two-component system cell cycle sensor histidine kinase/response regulator CckA